MPSIAGQAAACQSSGIPTASRSYTAVPNELLDAFVDWELSRLDLCVYLVLLRFRWRGDPFPRIKLLGERVGASESSVKRSLHTLESVGLVEVEERIAEHRGHTSNIYHLRLVAALEPSSGAALTEVGSRANGGGFTGGPGVKKKPGPENPIRRNQTDRWRPQPARSSGELMISRYGRVERG
jgi:predicted transcriptional regulator